MAELRRLYAKNLLPFYEELEKRRKGVLNAYIIAMLLATGASFGVYMMVGFADEASRKIVMYAGVLVYGFMGWLVKASYHDPYTKYYKANVAKKVFELIAPDLQYSPQSYVSQDLYRRSKIFSREVNIYKGDDRLSGKIGDTLLEFSELHTQRRVRSGKRTHYETIFRGIFFVADFN